jgi:hypothetical protein
VACRLRFKLHVLSLPHHNIINKIIFIKEMRVASVQAKETMPLRFRIRRELNSSACSQIMHPIF